MLKNIIFWGATGHAKVLRESVERVGYKLVAVFDNNVRLQSPFPDIPLYYGLDGFEQWNMKGREDMETACLVAIGGANGRDRVNLQHFLEAHQLRPVEVVHPTAFVAANAVISKGCQVLANAAICSDVSLGEGCIINTASSVDHESVLGTGVHIAPGAILAGCVSVGDYSLIGVGAVVLPRVKIGSDVIVGAGSVITKDIPDNKVVYGNPARIKRDKINNLK